MLVNLLLTAAFFLIPVAESQCPHGYGKEEGNSKKPVNKQILEDFLKESDAATIKATWSSAKKNGNIGPKTFLKYFEAEPKAKEKFASFAKINHFDLPTNSDFLAQAERCVSNLDAYVEHVGEDPKRCPFVAKAKGKYHNDDLKLLGATLIGVLEEELGDSFNDESRESWRKGLKAMSEAVSGSANTSKKRK